VTEGILRLLFRRIDPNPPYVYPTPIRSFAKKDAMPLVPGEIVKLDIDLYPISYLFRRGHTIRVAIAGADADHFAQIPSRAPTLSIYRDASRPSALVLPEMPR
jgi:predicted acyl esterase